MPRSSSFFSTSNKPTLHRTFLGSPKSSSGRGYSALFKIVIALGFISLLYTSSGYFSNHNSSYELLASGTTQQVQVQSSRHATVMGMATNLHIYAFKTFVGSLRNSGFQGHIILIVENLGDGAKEYLESQNVTMKFLKQTNCTFDPSASTRKKNEEDMHHVERYTCADPYPSLKLRWGRFALLRDYLRDCRECAGPVLVTDVRDTFFQRDLFGPDAPPVEGLQVFEEHPSQRTTHWITQGPIEECKKIKIFDRVMLCSGTTIGTRQAMLDYLGAMVQEMQEWMSQPDCCCQSMSGDDQSIHNWLYYEGKLGPHVTAVPNAQGLVNTVGVMGSRIHDAKRDRGIALGMTEGDALDKPYTSQEDVANGKWLGVEYGMTDDQGYFRNLDWERSFVIHQFDRFGHFLDDWLWTHGPLKGHGNRYSYP
jgi:hypothetical protein